MRILVVAIAVPIPTRDNTQDALSMASRHLYLCDDSEVISPVLTRSVDYRSPHE